MLSYCGELIKAHDPDRFFISLMMPPEKREALWALYAFNYEIAKTREVVTDTTLGLIRLQWWRDGVSEMYEGKEVRQNEIFPVLAKAIKDHDLPQRWLEKLCYAREFDLEGVIPVDLGGLDNYAVFTHKPLNQLALKVLGVNEGDEDIEAVSVAYTLAGLLKSVPFHASQQRCYMPANLLAKYNIPERNLYEFKNVETFKPIAEDICKRIRQHLSGCCPSSGLLKKQKKAATLVCAQLHRNDYDVFNIRFAQKPAFFHLRLFLTF